MPYMDTQTQERSMPADQELEAYIATALWSSIDEQPDGNGGPPMDDNYGPEDLAPETIASMRADIEAFLSHPATEVQDALEFWVAELRDGQIGHDFWLTRNGHGAGFWVRFSTDPGESYGAVLTAATEPYGGSILYVGDDGKVYAA
jgi:hypothetical protein